VPATGAAGTHVAHIGIDRVDLADEQPDGHAAGYQAGAVDRGAQAPNCGTGVPSAVMNTDRAVV
jgi:hypothetical protein